MLRILKIMVVLGIFLSACFALPTSAQAPTLELTKYNPRELVHYFAEKYQVSEKDMVATISCESSWNIAEVGDHNTSFGLVQIHLPAHKDITKEQALDPVFSTEFMAKSFSQKQGNMWTCYRWLKEGKIT